MSIIFSLLAIIGPILVFGIVLYIIITMIKNNEKKTKFKLSPKILLQIYLYVISFLTLAIAVIGVSLAIKASSSYYVDLPFSYTLQKANSYEEFTKFSDPTIQDKEEFEECYNGKTVQEYGKDFCFDSSQRKSDLITGISLFVSMTILFIVHQYAISKIKEKDSIVWLKKLYTFLSLILYSIAGIIVIPTSIYLLTNYFLFEITDETYSTPSAPAMALAFMIFIIPLWIYFLRKTTQLKEE